MPDPKSRPTVASLKKVTPDNLATLGVGLLAEILADVADRHPDLKRRLRMELAAAQGADHLAAEIDKRLDSHAISRSRVSWRKRAGFVADLDVLRALIVDRLALLHREQALQRLWRFMDVARRLDLRVRDRNGQMEAVFRQAATDLGGLLEGSDDATRLVAALSSNPSSWTAWLPALIATAPPHLAAATLAHLKQMRGQVPEWVTWIRQLADATGDADAFRSTFTPEALRDPSVAGEVGARLLAAGRVEEAGEVLRAAQPSASERRGLLKVAPTPSLPPDYDWETAWIEYLEQVGEGEAAQRARWASFERTLAVDRLKAFTRRLKDFDDVAAEERAIDYAAQHPDFQRGLAFLIDWPALPAAAQMIRARADEIQVSDDRAELWATKLRARQPEAAHLLLRRVAAAAFRRRDFATCDRLTQEADNIQLDQQTAWT